jgi:hypothetical protein
VINPKGGLTHSLTERETKKEEREEREEEKGDKHGGARHDTGLMTIQSMQGWVSKTDFKVKSYYVK